MILSPVAKKRMVTSKIPESSYLQMDGINSENVDGLGVGTNMSNSTPNFALESDMPVATAELDVPSQTFDDNLDGDDNFQKKDIHTGDEDGQDGPERSPSPQPQDPDIRESRTRNQPHVDYAAFARP